MSTPGPGRARRDLLDRSRRWTRWVEERMAKPGAVLVAVGAGHLVGADGVPAALERPDTRWCGCNSRAARLGCDTDIPLFADPIPFPLSVRSVGSRLCARASVMVILEAWRICAMFLGEMI